MERWPFVLFGSVKIIFPPGCSCIPSTTDCVASTRSTSLQRRPSSSDRRAPMKIAL